MEIEKRKDVKWNKEPKKIDWGIKSREERDLRQIGIRNNKVAWEEYWRVETDNNDFKKRVESNKKIIWGKAGVFDKINFKERRLTSGNKILK